MTSERFSAPFELKRQNVDQGVFDGYASVFGPPADSHGDIIAPGAFADTLKQRLPVLLWAHDQAQPIGKWLSVKEDSAGLRVQGKLTLGTQGGADAYALLLDGIGGLSIGYRVAPGGQSFDGNTRTLTKLDLFEISIVSLPASSRAQINSVKDHRPDITSPRELERALRELGLSQKQAKRFMAEGYHGLLKTDEQADLEAIGAKFSQLTAFLRS